MTESDRLSQKYDFLIRLGALFGPIQHLAEHPELYDDQERAETMARYSAEFPQLTQEFLGFTQGQPGHNYMIEYSRFSNALHKVMSRMVGGERNLKDVVDEHFPAARDALVSVPVPRTSVILEAGTPFTTYARLKALCDSDATKSLAWLDPYVSAVIFLRYLGSVREEAGITIVTQEPSAQSGTREKLRWDAFLDVSRMFGQERGPARYRLVVQPTLHDRWVVFDEKRIYSLGGSAKDAGARDYFTITSVDVSNLGVIQSHISTGKELFGPSTLTHA